MSSPPRSPAPYDQLPDFAENLVLIAGIGRSGTTALHQALGHHPDLIDAPSEAPLERSIAVSHGQMVARPEKFQTYVKKQTKAPWDHIRLSRRNMIFEAAFGLPAGERFLGPRRTERGDVDEAKRWVAKVGGISKNGLLGFQDLFTDFRTVYIHRNGIDTVSSRTKFYGFSSNTFAANCETWAKTALDMRTVVNNSNATVVRHADLLNDPETLFAHVFEGLGVSAHPGPAAHSRASITHPTQTVEDGGSVEDHFKARPPAHAEWTEQEQQTFIEICGSAMSKLGYDIPFA